MEAGSLTLLVRPRTDGCLERLHGAYQDLLLAARPAGRPSAKQAALVVVQPGGGGGEGDIVATVDRPLTNQQSELRQNQRGVKDPAGLLALAIRHGVASARVLQAHPNAGFGVGVWRIEVDVILEHDAFSDAGGSGRTAINQDPAVQDAAFAAAMLAYVLEEAELEDGAGGAGQDGAAAGDQAEPVGHGGGAAGDNGAQPGGGGLSGSNTNLNQSAAQEQQEGVAGAAGTEPPRDIRDEIFQIVAPTDWQALHPDPPGLNCQLFRYQRRALSWMVWRETQPELGPHGRSDGGCLPPAAQSRGNPAAATGRGGGPSTSAAACAAGGGGGAGACGSADPKAAPHGPSGDGGGGRLAALGDYATQDLFWSRLRLQSGAEVWANPWRGGGLRRGPPPPPPRQRVGILADEMGLGKTVEVIALMLARPHRTDDRQHGDSHTGRPAANATDLTGDHDDDHDDDGGGGGGACEAGAVKREQADPLQQRRWWGQRGDGAGAAAAALPSGIDPWVGRPRGPNLIVTPQSILQQWKCELAQHCNLKVEVYDGLDWYQKERQEAEERTARDVRKQAKLQEQQERQRRKQEKQAARVAGEGRRRGRGAAAATAATGSRVHNGAGPSTASAPVPYSPPQQQQQPGLAQQQHVGRNGRKAPRSGTNGLAAAQPGTVANGTSSGHPGATATAMAPPGAAPHAHGGRGGAGGRGPGSLRIKLVLGQRRPNEGGAGSTHTAGGSGSGGISAAAPGGVPPLLPHAASGAAANAAPATSTRASALGALGGVQQEEEEDDDEEALYARLAKRRAVGGGKKPAPAAVSAAGAAAAAPSGTAPTLPTGNGTATEAALAARAAAAAVAEAVAPPVRQSRMARFSAEMVSLLYAGTPLCPATSDPQAEAAGAVRKLLQADVVLTTYQVLQREVHYNPDNERMASLRYAKKYNVPESPLQQIAWHRLILDEAQMVGSELSAVATMAARITATHRWCVTGTPIGPGGMQDIHGLLKVLQYRPLDELDVFRRLVAEPYLSGRPEGRSRLAALLKPIMWRNSKAVAAQDHPLPRRTLQEVLLRFPAPERAFYDHILDSTRDACAKLRSRQQQQQHAAAASGAGPSSAAGPSNGDISSHASNGKAAQPQPQPQQKRTKKDTVESLRDLAGQELLQLRLACIHPQLTKYWRELRSELNLETETPTIDVVVARMRDLAQLRLQNAERDLCMVYNALASRLLATAAQARKLGLSRQQRSDAKAAAAAAAAEPKAAVAAAAGANGSPAAKRRKVAGGGGPAAPKPSPATAHGGGASPANGLHRQSQDGGDDDEDNEDAGDDEEMREAEDVDGAGAGGGNNDNGKNARAAGAKGSAAAAFRFATKDRGAAELLSYADRLSSETLQLLEASWRVGENGIEAAEALEASSASAGASGPALALGGAAEDDVDIKAAGASIRAWRLVQAHTAHLLAEQYGGMAGQEEPAARMRAYVQSRLSDVRSTADREMQRVVARHAALKEHIAVLEVQVEQCYAAACAAGYPTYGEHSLPQASEWLAAARARLVAAKAEEASQRQRHQEEADAAAGTGVGSRIVAMLGREVITAISHEEAPVNQLRSGLEAAAGSLLVEQALARLRAAMHSLSQPSDDGGRAPPPPPETQWQWQEVVAGGVRVRVPAAGLGGGHADPRAVAAGSWLLQYWPDLGLLRRALLQLEDVASVATVAANARACLDFFSNSLAGRYLQRAHRVLDNRLKEQLKVAENRSTKALRALPLSTLMSAVEAVKARVDVLRAWRDEHTAALQVEMAVHSCEIVTEEVMAAASGNIAGMGPLLAAAEAELREQIDEIKARCDDHRAKKAFYHNTYLEALRTAGRGAATAAGAAAGARAAGGASGADAATDGPSAHSAAAALAPSGGTGGGAGPSTPSAALAAAAAEAGPSTSAVAAARGRLAGDSMADEGLRSGAAGRPGLESTSGADPGGARSLVQQQQPQQLQGMAAAAPHVGVARCTGLWSCLYQWAVWVPTGGQQQQQQQQQHEEGQAAAPQDGTVDLTGAAEEEQQAGAAAAAAAAAVVVDLTADMEVDVVVAATAAQQQQQSMLEADAQSSQQQQERKAPGEAEEATRDSGAAGHDGGRGAAAAAAGGTGAGAGPSLTDGDKAAAAAKRAAAAMAAQAAAAAAAFGVNLGREGDDGDGAAEGLVCPICIDQLSTDVQLYPCGHMLCADCSKAALEHQPRCPQCRAHVPAGSIKVVVAGAAAGAAGQRGPGRGGGGAGGAATGNGPEVNPPEGTHIINVKVAGDAMTKMAGLMRRLVWLRDERPAEKSLVFSQWGDALAILKQCLKDNGIGYVVLESGRKGRQAITSFLQDDACRVFLLSLRTGAAGLTLVRANHVFLLEPSLDPAIEQQAVARVHRIGQTRDVTVTRLLVDGTIEMGIMRMLQEKQQLFMEAGSGAAAAGGAGGGGAGGGGGVTVFGGGEEDEAASLATAAPRQEVMAGDDMAYLLDSLL